MYHYVCRVLDKALAYDYLGIYSVLLGCSPKEGGGYTYTEKRDFENPLEACSYYFGSAESSVRRQIEDKLEAEGKNRYTGEKT